VWFSRKRKGSRRWKTLTEPVDSIDSALKNRQKPVDDPILSSIISRMPPEAPNGRSYHAVAGRGDRVTYSQPLGQKVSKPDISGRCLAGQRGADGEKKFFLAYLGVILLIVGEERLQRIVPRDDEPGGIDKELAGDVEEDQEEVDGDETEEGIDLRDRSLLLEVVEQRILGELQSISATVSDPCVPPTTPARAVGGDRSWEPGIPPYQSG
jgi:hypothetical protein